MLYNVVLVSAIQCESAVSIHISLPWVSLVAQTVKNPHAVQETWVCSPGWKNPPEKEMATHSSILAWRIPRTEEPGPWDHKE